MAPPHDEGGPTRPPNDTYNINTTEATGRDVAAMGVPRPRLAAMPVEPEQARAQHRAGCRRRHWRVVRVLDELLCVRQYAPSYEIAEIDYRAAGADLGVREREAAGRWLS